jgi:hypothetical protein
MATKATITTDHDEIRRWAEQRGGQPAAIKTGKRGGAGILRIDFPRGKKLPHVSWDEWFATFDQSHLGFLHSDEGRFNKLVSLDEKNVAKSARGQAPRRAHAATGTKGRATKRGAKRTTRTARGHAPARRTGRSRTGE